MQDENNIEFNKKSKHKNSSLSQDKIYFFRTSLFTEKSKSLIQRMNSCSKKIIKSNVQNDFITPKINQENLATFREKNEKIFLLDNKNKSKKIEEQINNIKINIKKDIVEDNYSDNKNNSNNNKNCDKNNTDKKEESINKIKDINNKNDDNNDRIKHDNIKNNDLKLSNIKHNNINKSANNIIEINRNNNIVQMKSDNKSRTENKKGNNINNKKIFLKQKIESKEVAGIKRCKLFSLSNAVNKNNKINNKCLVGNNIGKSQFIANILFPNANNKTKNLIQKKEKEISNDNYKIKYKLKSKKASLKEKDNKNFVSFKFLCDNNTMKKEFKYIPKQNNIQSFSVFDDNYHISRYKLGNYLVKRNNNRYHNKNVVSEDKINIKLKIQGMHKKNKI